MNSASKCGFLGEQAERQAALAMDLALVRLVATGREPEQGRLAGAVRADEADPIAQRDGRVDAVEDDERPDLAGDVGQTKDRHRPSRRPTAAWRRPVGSLAAFAACRSARVSPRLPSPASSVQRRPTRSGVRH